MFINNLKEDFKRVIKMQGKTQLEVAESIGLPSPNVSRALDVKIPDRFIKIWESLGYDIKITYVKRNQSAEDILKRG